MVLGTDSYSLHCVSAQRGCRFDSVSCISRGSERLDARIRSQLMVARHRIEQPRAACRHGDFQSGTPSQGRSVHVTPFQTRSFNHLAGCLPNHCTTVPNRAPLIHAKFPQGICSIFVSLGPRISEARWTSLLACLRKVANLFCKYPRRVLLRPRVLNLPCATELG